MDKLMQAIVLMTWHNKSHEKDKEGVALHAFRPNCSVANMRPNAVNVTFTTP